MSDWDGTKCRHRRQERERPRGTESMPNLKRLLARPGTGDRAGRHRNEVLERRLSSISGALEGAVRMQGRPVGRRHPEWPPHRTPRRALQVRRRAGRAAPQGVREGRHQHPAGPEVQGGAPHHPQHAAPRRATHRGRRRAGRGSSTAGSVRSRRLVERAAVRAGKRVLESELRRDPGEQHPVAGSRRGSRVRRRERRPTVRGLHGW